MPYGVHEEQPRVTNEEMMVFFQVINILYAWKSIEFDLKFMIANGNLIFWNLTATETNLSLTLYISASGDIIFLHIMTCNMISIYSKHSNFSVQKV